MRKDLEKAQPGWTLACGGVLESRRRVEWLKTAAALVMTIYAMALNAVGVALVNEVSVRGTRLPDAVFEIIPRQKWALPVADACAILSLLLILFLLLFHSLSALIFRRLCFCMALMYYFRVNCLALTVLPGAYTVHNTCADQSPSLDGAAVMKKAGLTLATFGASSSGKMTCGDYLFSGHTIPMVLGFSFFCAYAPPSLFLLPVKIFFGVIVALGLVSLCISRSHYTVDVIISAILCRLVFHVYHLYVAVPWRDRSSLPPDLIWLEWLEWDVPSSNACVTLLYWPWTWPACLHRLLDSLNSGAFSFFHSGAEPEPLQSAPKGGGEEVLTGRELPTFADTDVPTTENPLFPFGPTTTTTTNRRTSKPARRDTPADPAPA